MANVKLSELTAASQVADANEFEINEAGVSKKVTGAQIQAYVNAGDGALAAKDTVATADIDDAAITGAKLAADVIDGTKLADNAVDSEHITAGAIDTSHIGNAQITEAKLSSGAGSADQILTSDGAGNLAWADPAGGAAELLSVSTFNSSGTWTANPTATKVSVFVAGGGGAGAAGYANTPNAYVYLSGGGGGGTAAAGFPIATAGASQPVTVGGAGTQAIPPGQNGNSNGNAGGTSSFGGMVVANGGAGGTASNTRAAGGNGAVNVSATFTTTGQGAQAGAGTSGAGIIGNGGGASGGGFNRFPGSPSYYDGAPESTYKLNFAPQAAGEAALASSKAWGASGIPAIWTYDRPTTNTAESGRVLVFEWKD